MAAIRLQVQQLEAQDHYAAEKDAVAHRMLKDLVL
jgi:hypothetical protein